MRCVRSPESLPDRRMFRLGFRAFFLVAGALAVVLVPLWLAAFFGGVTLPTRFYGPTWHGHEMVFGFAVAVIAGFLLTAVRNWTGLPTASGVRLGALVALFVLGRVCVLFSAWLPWGVVVAVDLAFLPVLAIEIAIPVMRKRNWRNLVFAALLTALFVTNTVFYVLPIRAALMVRLAIDIIVVMMVVIGGRVIPSFTESAVDIKVRRYVWLERASVLAVVAVALTEVVAPRVCAVFALIAGASNALRLVGWRSLATRNRPILWVLHAGYAWLVVGLFLKGLLPESTAAMHALAVGAIGTLILAMTTRVSLGHTGRALVVPRPIVVAYGAILAAAVLRAVGPLIAPSLNRSFILLSGFAWTLAFALFMSAYAPILVAPRIDGRPG